MPMPRFEPASISTVCHQVVGIAADDAGGDDIEVGGFLEIQRVAELRVFVFERAEAGLDEAQAAELLAGRFELGFELLGVADFFEERARLGFQLASRISETATSPSNRRPGFRARCGRCG